MENKGKIKGMKGIQEAQGEYKENEKTKRIEGRNEKQKEYKENKRKTGIQE